MAQENTKPLRKVKPVNHAASLTSMLKNMAATDQYPTIRIPLDCIPEAKDWEIGEDYEVDMVLRMVGLTNTKHEQIAEFEIREVGPEDDEGENENENPGFVSEGGTYKGQ